MYWEHHFILFFYRFPSYLHFYDYRWWCRRRHSLLGFGQRRFSIFIQSPPQRAFSAPVGGVWLPSAATNPPRIYTQYIIIYERYYRFHRAPGNTWTRYLSIFLSFLCSFVVLDRQLCNAACRREHTLPNSTPITIVY